MFCRCLFCSFLCLPGFPSTPYNAKRGVGKHSNARIMAAMLLMLLPFVLFLCTGQWVNNQRHGEGRMQYSNGDAYDGVWIKDQRNGLSKYFYANGDVFVGRYEQNRREGLGTIYMVNTTPLNSVKQAETVHVCCSIRNKWSLAAHITTQPFAGFEECCLYQYQHL